MYLKVCHCGHDVTSHYEDGSVQPPERISCLVCGCDCKRYPDRNVPKPPPGPPAYADRPKHAPWCRCVRCVEWSKHHGPSQERVTEKDWWDR